MLLLNQDQRVDSKKKKRHNLGLMKGPVFPSMPERLFLMLAVL